MRRIKKTRKKKQAKRHKGPAAKKRAAVERARRWVHDPDTPLRKLLRGAVNDWRLMGNPDDAYIELGKDGRDEVANRVKEMLASGDPQQVRQAVRTAMKIEQLRLQALQREIELGKAVIEGFVTEIMTKVQAALEHGAGGVSGTEELNEQLEREMQDGG